MHGESGASYLYQDAFVTRYEFPMLDVAASDVLEETLVFKSMWLQVGP